MLDKWKITEQIVTYYHVLVFQTPARTETTGNRIHDKEIALRNWANFKHDSLENEASDENIVYHIFSLFFM